MGEGEDMRDGNRRNQMIADRKSGLTMREIAEKYGVSYQRVSQIVGRQSVRNFQAVTDCPYPNLKRWMNDNLISRRELSKRVYGYSNTTTTARLGSYIRGEVEPNKRTIDKLLEVTGMSYEVLFAKEESMTEYEKTEQAYKNGYAKGFADGQKAAEPKRGRWISKGYKLECSVCEHRAFLGTVDPVIHREERNTRKYCFNCGAKMEG